MRPKSKFFKEPDYSHLESVYKFHRNIGQTEEQAMYSIIREMVFHYDGEYREYARQCYEETTRLRGLLSQAIKLFMKKS